MTSFTEFDEIPSFKYNFIMSDPPWQFELRSEKGESKSPQSKYRCMTIEEIRAFDVARIASKNCYLWLWVTNPMLLEGISTLEAWGFKFITAGSWAKKTRERDLKCGCVRPGKYRWGPGYVLRSTNEPFLIGRMGELDITPIQSGFDGLAREHSRKPEIAYELAEKFMPKAWRLDMFSRETREGWDNFGDECELFDA